MLSYFLTLVGLAFGSALPNELALQQKLYSNYTNSVPCVNCPINIYLGVSLRSLLDVSEITGTYDMNIWLRHWWKDERLSWNPDHVQVAGTVAKNHAHRHTQEIQMPCQSVGCNHAFRREN